MSSEKMREEFEIWVKSNWPAQSLDRFNPLHGVTEGEYTGFTVQHCWDAWQASRAAIVIELPETPNRGIGYGLFDAGKERCAEAIEAAGLKVKP